MRFEMVSKRTALGFGSVKLKLPDIVSLTDCLGGNLGLIGSYATLSSATIKLSV